jgi:plastocyanin
VAAWRICLVLRPIVSTLALLALLALAACGGAGTSAPASQPPVSQPAASQPAGSPAAACADADSGTVAVSIADNTFSPDPVTTTVGQAIAWTNQDDVPHTATLDEGDCATETLNNAQSGALVFSAAGTYAYHCAIHPEMTGSITVTE